MILGVPVFHLLNLLAPALGVAVFLVLATDRPGMLQSGSGSRRPMGSTS